MKNLTALTYPVVVVLWILIFWSCSTALVNLPVFRSKLIPDYDLKPTIQRLEENRRRVISLEKRQTYIAQTPVADRLLLTHYLKPVQIELAWPQPSYTLTQMNQSRQMSFGLISDTHAHTTCIWEK